MAERKDALHADQGGDEPVDQAGPKPAGNHRFWMVLIPVILLPAVGGAVLALQQYPSIALKAAEVRMRFASDESDGEMIREYGHFTSLENIIVNPRGSDGKRFLMVNLGLETISTDVVTEIGRKEIVVRDTILKVLSSYSVEELAALESRSTLKDELLTAINSVLQRGAVEYLYFTQYVLQ